MRKNQKVINKHKKDKKHKDRKEKKSKNKKRESDEERSKLIFLQVFVDEFKINLKSIYNEILVENKKKRRTAKEGKRHLYIKINLS